MYLDPDIEPFIDVIPEIDIAALVSGCFGVTLQIFTWTFNVDISFCTLIMPS